MKAEEKILHNIIATQRAIDYCPISKSGLAESARLKEHQIGYLKSYARNNAIEFKMDTGSQTPIIIDGRNKVRELTEREYDTWKKGGE